MVDSVGDSRLPFAQIIPIYRKKRKSTKPEIVIKDKFEWTLWFKEIENEIPFWTFRPDKR